MINFGEYLLTINLMCFYGLLAASEVLNDRTRVVSIMLISKSMCNIIHS